MADGKPTQRGSSGEGWVVGIGSPACLLLDHWARMLREVFGVEAYHVGSSATSKTWRDVDVRVILEDDDYEAWFGAGSIGRGSINPKWSAICTAFSLWGREVTGLPIDFQVQARSAVKESDWDKVRHPLGIFVDYTRGAAYAREAEIQRANERRAAEVAERDERGARVTSEPGPSRADHG